jgi:ferredoxin-nitrate reductase
VVVQEISNLPETLKYADVVLPAASWSEKEGTMTNAERRISYLNKISEAPGEALPDSEIISRFAQKMGYRGFGYTSPSQIYEEHCALTRGSHIDISGLNYETLKQKNPVQWPYPTQANEGTARLFTDKKFYTSSKKAIIHSFTDINESEQPNETYPLVLTTGRIRDQWHTMSKTGKVNKLKQHISEAFLEIHPEDAVKRNIEEGQLVEVFNARGNVRVRAKHSFDIKKGVVFLPMHWGKILNSDLNRANNLTNNLLDCTSKQPDFKFSAVEVNLYKKHRQKIVIVGAGAGSFAFIKNFRALNKEDEIVVFSKENFPFYNRILLPDYISGSQKWEHLVKMNAEEEFDFNLRLFRGVSIEKIDREQKVAFDSNGETHTYDVLIIAAGSRAAVLKDSPQLPGIFTMRSRLDADKFKYYIDPSKGKVVIVGGGLLGIELAASLHDINIDVTVIQRISRLMDRQLDPLGSSLLHELLTDKGIQIYYNDEVERFIGTKIIEGIRLKSGVVINCQAVVIAVGTIPNIEIAQSAGLTCNRGILVNEYLQTNDPSVYAIGEVAEFKGFLYGITAAAEEQALIVARHLSGDISKIYGGSLLMNILKMHGADVCSLGLPEAPDDPAFEEVVFIDKAKCYYKKCIIHNDRLVGAILIGDKTEFLEFRDLIENKIELSDKRLHLLRSGKKAEPVIGKVVCSCAGIGEGNIINKIAEGCKDLVQLCQLSGAGMGCGSCRSEVKTILEQTVDKKHAKATVEMKN